MDVSETVYDEPLRPMKTLIRDLQAHNDWVRSFRDSAEASSKRRRTRSQARAFDDEGLLRHKDCLYIPGDSVIREELIAKCHNNPLAGHFSAAKTHELLVRKYY